MDPSKNPLVLVAQQAVMGGWSSSRALVELTTLLPRVYRSPTWKQDCCASVMWLPRAW